MSAVKLQELEQVSLRVLERRDPPLADVLEVLHKLDARLPEPAALLRDVVRFETDDVAGGERLPAPAFPLGGARYPPRIRLPVGKATRALYTRPHTQKITRETGVVV